MLREDKKARFAKHPTIFGRPRWRFMHPKVVGPDLEEAEFIPLVEQQMKRAVPIFHDGEKQLWMFRDKFYWEDEGLTEEDVTALALERERKRERQLERAHGMARAGESTSREGRQPIPREVKLAVHERDSGRCVRCGSTALL